MRSDQVNIHTDGYKLIDNRLQFLNKCSNTGSGGVGIAVADHLYHIHCIKISNNCVDGVLVITLIKKCSDYKLLFATVKTIQDYSLHGIVHEPGP